GLSFSFEFLLLSFWLSGHQDGRNLGSYRSYESFALFRQKRKSIGGLSTSQKVAKTALGPPLGPTGVFVEKRGFGASMLGWNTGIQLRGTDRTNRGTKLMRTGRPRCK